MTDKITDLQEAVAGVLADHFDSYNYDILYKYVAPDILNELKYHELIDLVMKKDKEIAELKTLISFERDQQQAEVNILNDDIKFLRSKLPNL